MRLRGTSAAELEKAGEDTDGLITDASKLYDTVKNLTKVTGKDGVSIMNTDTGGYKSTYKMMLEIAKVYNQLSDQNQAALLETMAGKTRGAAVAAILQNPELLESAYNDAMNSTEGAGEKAIENSMDSIEKRMAQLKNAWMNIWQTSINSDGLKTALQIIEKLIEGLGKIMDLIGPINTGLLAFGGVQAFRHRKDIMGFASIAKDLQNLKSVMASGGNVSTVWNSLGPDTQKRMLAGKDKGILNKPLLNMAEQAKLQEALGNTAASATNIAKEGTDTAEIATIDAKIAAYQKELEAKQALAGSTGEVVAGETAEATSKEESIAAIEEKIAALEEEKAAKIAAAGASEAEVAAEEESTVVTEANTLAKEEQVGANAAGTASNSAFAASFEALAASIGVSTVALGAFLGVAAGIAVAVMAVKKYQQVQKEQAEAAQKVASGYQETAKSMEDYKSQYSSLQDQLAAAKGNAAETKNVQSQILELQKEINSQYGDTYGKIDLITGAYDKQSDVLDKYSQKMAKQYIDEHRLDAGVRDAEDNMSKVGTYQTTLLGGQAERVLRSVAKNNDAIHVDNNNNGELILTVEADPQSAVEAYNEIVDALEKDAASKPDPHIWDQPISQIEATAEEAQAIVDEYGEIRQSMIDAEIQANSKPREYYNQITDAVQEYQDAVFEAQSKGTELVDSKEVEVARKKLTEISKNPLFKDSRYGRTFQKMFEDAKTGAYDFSKAIADNEDGLRDAADAISGYSDEALRGFDDSGANANFEKLRAAAETYGASIEDVISQVERLGASHKTATSFTDLDNMFPNLDAYRDQLKSTTDAVTLLGTAMSEMDSAGALTTETYNNLSSSTSLLKSALEMGAKGYQVNADKARTLIKADADIATAELGVKQALASEQYDINLEKISKLEAEKKKLGSSETEARSAIDDSIASLKTENSNLQSSIASYSQLSSQIHQATSAYSMWTAAQQGPEEGDQYDSMITGLKDLKDLYDKGLTGKNAFKTGVDALFPEGDWDNTYYAKLQSWFKDNATGPQNFLKSMSKVKSEFGKISQDKDGTWNIKIGNKDEFIKDAHITETVFDALMGKLHDYNFKINYDEPQEGIKGIQDEITELENYINYVNKEGLDIDTSSSEERIKKLKEQIKELTKLGDQEKVVEDLKKKVKNTKDDAKRAELQKKLDAEEKKLDEIKAYIDQVNKQTEDASKGSVNAQATVDSNGNITVTVNVPNKADKGSGEEKKDTSEKKERKQAGEGDARSRGHLTNVERGRWKQDIAKRKDQVVKQKVIQDPATKQKAIQKEVKQSVKLTPDISDLKNAKIKDQEAKVHLTADNSQAQAAMDETTREGNKLADSTFSTTLDANNKPALDKTADATEKTDRFGRLKAASTLSAKDKATPIVNNVEGKVTGLNKVSGSPTIGISGAQGVSGVLDGIISKLKKIAGEWKGTVSITHTSSSGKTHGGGGGQIPSLNSATNWKGTARLRGSAFVKGTPRGDWGLPKDEYALTGELGPELVVIFRHLAQ